MVATIALVIKSVSPYRIPRCYKPEGFRQLKSVELHHFSNANKDAYGQCSYLRLVNQSDQIHCSLVMAKSCAASLKPVTIPRELEHEEITETFWTDSKVVIRYISNDARRFHVSIANRVQQIEDHTSPSQLKYVETDLNPTDDASRGENVQGLIENLCWWTGPDFLLKTTRRSTAAS